MGNCNSKSDLQNLIFIFSVFCTEDWDSLRKKKRKRKEKRNCLLFLFITLSVTQMNDTPKVYIVFVTNSSGIH